MKESAISVEKALTLIGGNLTFEFEFSTDHGPEHVRIDHEGVVRISHDYFGLLDSIVECLEDNIGIMLETGANFRGIVLRLDDRNCVALIPPYGEGTADPQQAQAAGWIVCETAEVWVKAVLDAATFTLCTQQVEIPKTE